MAGQLPSGGTSYAAAEQRALTSQRSVEDEEEQLSHVRQLEKVRDSLLEEVTYLSERNAELEEGGEAIDTLRAKMDVQAKTMDALLTLLGEKEEEVEAQLGDMREVKTLCRPDPSPVRATRGLRGSRRHCCGRRQRSPCCWK